MRDIDKPISRGGFLKLPPLLLGAILLQPTIDKLVGPYADKQQLGNRHETSKKSPESPYYKSMSITAQEAAKYAQSVFGEQPYEFGKRDCAMYVAEFVSYFGILNQRDTTATRFYAPQVPEDPLPNATTVKQVMWFEIAAKGTNNPEEVILYPTNREIEKEEFWKEKVMPGSIIYLRTKGESQHGYDQYSHTAAFVGLDNQNNPIFAEYAPGMKRGPETNRSLRQLLSMYKGKNPTDLRACIVNVPKLSIEIWGNRNEKVKPNSEIIMNECEGILTVNINSGVTTYWKRYGGEFLQSPFANGRLEVYGVTGRGLLPRPGLTEKYRSIIEKEKLPPSSYSVPEPGVACLFGSPSLGVPRLYLTPPLVFMLDDFLLIGNFGKLGGVTLAALMRVLSLNQGKINCKEENSNYTIHATPQRTKGDPQDLLLRDRIINNANKKGHPPDPNEIHLTSGCVNFPPETFEVIRKTLESDDKKGAIKGPIKGSIKGAIGVVFSYPDYPQDRLLENNFSYDGDPLGGGADEWGYTET